MDTLPRPYNVTLYPAPKAVLPDNVDLQVLLEDVRTRGDRQHPFWARLEGSSGRVSVRH